MLHQISGHLQTKSPTMSLYATRLIGQPNTLGIYFHPVLGTVANRCNSEHRIFIEMDGVPVSPFHDIPLYAKYVVSSSQASGA